MTKGHSEEYFSEDRDFWWNRDYLELMARRLRLNECGTLLDIGCGQCHWSRLLAPFLRKPAVVHALDTDPKWAAGSDELKRHFERLGVTIAFRQGDAQVLPYPDSSFDLVTCQTLLIHLPNPQAAVREMFRVAKPGGLVLCVEPNNLAGSLVKTSISAADPIEDRLQDVRCYMMRERGKAQCGEGDNSFGDLLPGVFAELGFDDIRVYLSDKASAVYPPYQAPGQQASLTAWLDMDAQGAGLFDRAEMQRYLTALGQESRVEEVLQHFRTENARMAAAIKAGDYATGGGVIMYLVSGRKPSATAAGQIAARTERRTEGGGLVRNRTNAAHYGWGDGCDGWRLHEDEAFGVIEELVPPGRAEVPHRHTHAGQAFVILEGEADLILEDGRHTLRGGDSLHVPAGVLHQFRNDSPKPVRFLVISAPRRDWDRIAGELPGRPAPAAGGGSLKRMPTLETARVVLRPFSAADAAEVMRLAGDRVVADTTLHIPHPYLAGMAEEWIATHQAAFDREQGVTLAITRKPDGALVGAISLMGMAKGHQAELGYWIGKPFWSQGYCTEAAQALLRYAFTDLGLVRVHAGHFTRNPASGRVMQKIGMHKEGCLRQQVKKWDRLEDLEIYAILKKEWKEAANQAGNVCSPKGMRREPACIFCQIAAGGARSWKVHETEHAYAFLDISPVNEFHTLVIPKRHYTDIFSVPEDELLNLVSALKYVVDLYHERLGIENVQILNSSGPQAQQDVFHLHFHLVPRHTGDGQDVKWSPHPEMRERFDEMLGRLRTETGEQPPPADPEGRADAASGSAEV